MEVAFEFVKRAVDFVLETSGRQVGYVIDYKRNVEKLRDHTVDLEDRSKLVDHKIQVARDKGEEILVGPKKWCQEAREKIEDSNRFHQHYETRNTTGCSRSILFLWYRHKLGRKADKMAKEVKLLTTDSRQIDDVAYNLTVSNDGYVYFESRTNTMKEIMKQLEESTVRMIGVLGPSGVGKTTFVKEIAKKARDNKLFDVVIIVRVTRNPNYEKIQKEIAYQLGLTFGGEGENVRADRLRERLKQEKENTLIILDDLWDTLDLRMLGISFDDDDDNDGETELSYKMEKNKQSSGVYKGCKILLTSVVREVFDKMKIKKNSIFRVKRLDDKEAEIFFKKVVEIPDENCKFKAENINKYCAGLPLMIISVGKALRNKSKSEQEYALENFQIQESMEEVQKYMEIFVKMNYDHLEIEELKSIFLLCAQMCHEPLIVDLVKCCYGLDILEGVYTLKDAHDRISNSIQKLKDSSLMLDGDSNGHFNMHDMVRDAALSIAYKDQSVFILRNDKLDDWPNSDELEKCTVISIYKSDIVGELPEVINCPQLRVFHIDNDEPSLNIPDRFFEGMEELRVLILTGIHLSSLPSSIKRLSNLRMLCLERCDLGNLSIIGDLKKLRILSLSGSKIENWPAELGGLSELQLLDISHCSIGNLIPDYFISSLTKLEELYIGKSLITMELEGETKQSQISVFSQLKHLYDLKIIDVCITSADVFPTDLFFDKLDDYKIVIGDFETHSMGDFRMPNKYEASRSLALQVETGMDIHALSGVKILLRRAENLLLGELDEVQNVVYLDGFPDLKKLSIVNNTGIEYIVNSMGVSYPLDAFPKLESLSLFHLMKIEKICCSPVTDGSFSRLKTIKVTACTKLKNLFSSCIVKFLVSLETIDVSECNQLKEIVDEGEVSECDQLKEIVIDEGEVSEKIEFHGLCSLTLQDLPSLTSFYTNDKQARHRDQTEIVFANNEQSFTIFLPLFGEKVEMPKLESLYLSSINIHKIWSDHLSTFCFQNLIKLTVNNCCNLTYLCSLSLASNLNKLKGLFVSNCQMMETLFTTEGDSKDYSKERIFPKLEEIQLIDMDILKDIWPAEVSAGSFPSLISLYIASCSKLGKIFPSNMNGWYRSLDSLKVRYCKSVEVIFEIKCPAQLDPFRNDTKLQLIDLTDLPNLKRVWSTDPNGVVNFKNLRSISVSSCPKLSYVLPSSVAKGLAKLEDFSIQSCVEIGEIVAVFETNNERLVFPEITSINFDDLQNMSCFYKGKHPVDCPKLKWLAVHNCPKLETFTTENANEERPVFLAEKVISNLEYLEIGQKEAEWLKSNIGKYRVHRLKQLCLKSARSVKILYWFLHRIPNLQKLKLDGRRRWMYSSVRELVPSGNTAPRQRLGAGWQLKELTLYGSNIEDIGFERDQLLQTIERLVLRSCGSLVNLAHHRVSFTQLTSLEVSFCSKLKKLMASSTAKSLVRLTTMKVIHCPELEEIVTNDDEGNEEEKVGVNIVFGKLITIELAGLANLTSFCSHKNCDFSFPSLEKLIFRDCPKMKTFTQSRSRAPKLQNVLVAEGIFEEGKCYWEGDLNSTIQTVSVESKYRHLELSGYPELKQVWCGKDLVPKNRFRNLKTLVVANIGYPVHVIPSHLLPCFKNLEELEVESCHAVQVIFNINDNRVTKAMGMFRLKKLSLRNLPRLEHVWDKDPEGIIGLRALQDLSFEECNSLKYVFPTSVAKELGMLIKLSVEDCEQLVEIFAEDIERASEGDTKSFVFLSLTSLKLRRLPALKYFYPGLHNLEFPVLEELHLHPCKWVILSGQEAEVYLEERVLVAVEKVNLLIHNLRKLSFDMGAATVTWGLKSKKLELEHLLNFSEQSDDVLYRSLQTVPNVEKLEVSYCSLKEVFSTERPNADYARVLSHLKELRLYSLNELKSIGLEHSWIHPIPENLQTLQVECCHQLKNLVPAAGTASFSNLTDLAVSYCRNLLYLFTSSTAKSLARLERMEISNCESMQEIVSTEGHESQESGQIIFEQLQSLSLKELAMLRCFYSGNYILCFPSLKVVSVNNCLLMETFCPFIRINQDLRLFLGSEFINKDKSEFIDEDVIPREVDIDTNIRKMNEKKIAKSARELRYLELGFKPHFQEMWRGSLPVPDACFSNLESLVVDGCEFLSEVLPSNLLPFLNKMHKLEVRNCSSVKTIFDAKYIPKDRKMGMGPALRPLPFSLKTLVLEKLPNLESVWNVDSHCEGSSETVARVEAAPEGTNLELTFPCLTSLTLLDLPKLKCFYCSLRCVQLKDPDPHIEDQGCAKEITPNLDNLLLGEEELKMIRHGQCQENHIPKVKVLDLQYFNVESNEFPYRSLPSSFNEVFGAEGPKVYSSGILLQLKGFKLPSLSELISIGLEYPWVEESFLKELETLEAASCSRLRNLVPSSIFFSSLMRLTVSNCEDMIHLFNTSTAKSLAQLKHMEISHGKTIQEIVSKEGGESHHNEIVFGQLQELKLEYLPKLESFYKGSLTLSFPSLEKLSIINCSRMDTFCVGTITANKLSGVKFKGDGDDTPLEVDLNFTILKAFKAQLAKFVVQVQNLELVDKPEVHAIWHDSIPVPSLCFIRLKSLVVEGCEFLSTAIPSHILGLLCKLEELVVRKCHFVKTIFEVKDTVKGKKKLINAGPAFSPPFRLKKLIFEQLPNLEHVWDSDPQEVIGLQNLQELYVNGCDSLEMLFPASVAKRLGKLEKLAVKECGRLVEIIAKDEAAKGGATKEFVMPCMNSIKLWFLPELKCFYPEPRKLECPMLKQVHLLHCDKLKTFTCESQSLPEAQSEYQVGIPLNPQALFLAEEVIPCLEFLAINKEMAMLIWHGQFHSKFLHKLKTVQLQCFHDDSDTFPYGLLQKVPNIVKLVVSCSSFKEIFSSERPTMDCAEKTLSHVKCLKLSSMAKLNSIGLEHSWVDPISENLEKLQIDQCHCLRNIVPCKVSFSSLIDLNVSQCEGLASLFTPSTSRTLSQLKNMSVTNCESLEEIVSEEEEESSNDDEEQITFYKLETLSLHSLPRLGRFYGGSLALSLPSLDELSVINCCKMESFCGGAISVNVNRWTTVKFKEDERAVPLKVDLNSAIRKAFEGTVYGQEVGGVTSKFSALSLILPWSSPS